MHTGENEQGLKKIIDMTRLISIAVLLMHFYHSCYGAFDHWKLTTKITDQLIKNISHTGLFNEFQKSKLIALGFLLLTILGVKGRKSEKLNYRIAFSCLLTGLLFYFISGFVLLNQSLDIITIAVMYMGITSLGFILVLTGGGLLTRIIKNKLNVPYPSSYSPNHLASPGLQWYHYPQHQLAYSPAAHI